MTQELPASESFLVAVCGSIFIAGIFINPRPAIISGGIVGVCVWLKLTHKLKFYRILHPSTHKRFGIGPYLFSPCECGCTSTYGFGLGFLFFGFSVEVA